MRSLTRPLGVKLGPEWDLPEREPGSQESLYAIWKQGGDQAVLAELKRRGAGHNQAANSINPDSSAPKPSGNPK